MTGIELELLIAVLGCLGIGGVVGYVLGVSDRGG